MEYLILGQKLFSDEPVCQVNFTCSIVCVSQCFIQQCQHIQDKLVLLSDLKSKTFLIEKLK